MSIDGCKPMNEFTDEQLKHAAIVKDLERKVFELQDVLKDVLQLYTPDDYAVVMRLCERSKNEIKAVGRACRVLLKHEGSDEEYEDQSYEEISGRIVGR